MQKIFLIICLSILLAACGFHLRGSEPMPTQLQTLHLITSEPYSPFTKLLERTLRNNGAQLVSNTQRANSLQILSTSLDQQVTSIGSGGQNTIYLLTFSIKYQLLNPQGEVVQTVRTVSAAKNYSAGSNQILGDTYVQHDLIADMQHDVIYQLLNQLRTQSRHAITP